MASSQAARAPPKAHDVIDIDDEEESVEEDEDEILDDEEEQYGDEDEEMDETMDDVTGDEDTESGVPLLEPRLKSVSGLLSKTQSRFAGKFVVALSILTTTRFPRAVYGHERPGSIATPSPDRRPRHSPDRSLRGQTRSIQAEEHDR